jgi:hypothetical protein
MERIENVEEEIDEFKRDMKRYLERMDENIEKLTNHYSQRPSWFICLLITALVGLCGILTQYCITHQGREYEPPSHTQQIEKTPETGQEEAYGAP